VHESTRTSRSRARSLWNGGPLFGDSPSHQTVPAADHLQYGSDYFHYARKVLSLALFHQQALYLIALKRISIKQNPSGPIVDIVSSAARLPLGVARLASVVEHPNVLSSVTKRFQNSTLGKAYELVLPHDGFPSAFASGALEEQIVRRKFNSFVLQLPIFAQDIVKSADPRGLVSRMLPSGLVPPGARYIATCFWAWLCVIDGEFVPILIDTGLDYPRLISLNLQI